MDMEILAWAMQWGKRLWCSKDHDLDHDIDSDGELSPVQGLHYDLSKGQTNKPSEKPHECDVYVTSDSQALPISKLTYDSTPDRSRMRVTCVQQSLQFVHLKLHKRLQMSVHMSQLQKYISAIAVPPRMSSTPTRSSPTHSSTSEWTLAILHPTSHTIPMMAAVVK
ncbi:hypothetical protein Ocin01_20129 [Orchesella cincta]|uniref:Uncharacterized protein n=1 Tax=Orchesella cincta TaxID=48709 RepID=A0A1D2M0S1_ORCCI|nr:hypothetical protein Ocin01_20129 [Orchesella cincta]